MKWLQKFMAGRYGVDQLSMTLIALSIIISIISRFINNPILLVLFIITATIGYYRIFSKKIWKRRDENGKFLKLYYPIRNKGIKIIERIKGFRKYKYFKCINCKQSLRVPRGKGRVSATCPKCNTIMIKKT